MNEHKIGFIAPIIEENHFRLGSLGDAVIKVDGNWKDYLPVFESQLEKMFDSCGCTCYATLNAIETLEKFLTGKEQNYSDRFVYNGVGITPPGSDPHLVAEFIRKNGLIFEEDLPDETNSLVEFMTPRPLTEDLVIKAGKWTWTLSHQWIITPSTSKENKVDILKAELLKGTVCVSVTAWYKNDQGLYYSPPELQNEHWTMVYDVLDTINVFDSYKDAMTGTNLKKLTLDHDIQYAKRYSLTRKLTTEQIGIWQKILNALKEMLGLMSKEVAMLPKESIPVIEKKPIITEIPAMRDLLTEFCTAISTFEGGEGDLNHKNNNPGNIKGVDGKFLKFHTWEDGFLYLKEYITNVATNKHKAYPKDCTVLQFFQIYAPTLDKNNPAEYALFVVKKIGTPLFLGFKIKDLLPS